MAVAVDTHGSNQNTSSAASVTTSFTVVGGGSATFLSAFANWIGSDTTRTLTSITYAAVTLDKDGGSQVSSMDGSGWGIHVKGLSSPASGANNMVTTLSASSAGCITHGWSSWTGVDSTTPFGTKVSGEDLGANASLGSISTSAGDAVTASIRTSGNAASTSSGNTESWEIQEVGFQPSCAGGSHSTSTSPTISWTNSGPFSLALAVPLFQTGGGPPAQTKYNVSPLFILGMS